MYNRVLKLPKVEYKYGFMSTKTEEVFKSGLENPK